MSKTRDEKFLDRLSNWQFVPLLGPFFKTKGPNRAIKCFLWFWPSVRPVRGCFVEVVCCYCYAACASAPAPSCRGGRVRGRRPHWQGCCCCCWQWVLLLCYYITLRRGRGRKGSKEETESGNAQWNNFHALHIHQESNITWTSWLKMIPYHYWCCPTNSSNYSFLRKFWYFMMCTIQTCSLAEHA